MLRRVLDAVGSGDAAQPNNEQHAPSEMMEAVMWGARDLYRQVTLGQTYYATTYTSALGIRRAALPVRQPVLHTAPPFYQREPGELALNVDLAAWLEQPNLSLQERSQRFVAAQKIQSAVVMRPGQEDGSETVYGDIDLSHLSALTALPPGLHRVRNLVLKGCSSLRYLPARLYVEGHFKLDHCLMLDGLPWDLRVDGHVSIRGCVRLRGLPQSLQINRGLDARGCRALEGVYAVNPLRGDVNFSGCTALVELQENFCVEGNLIMRGCSGLRRIERGLRVTGNFDATGCYALNTVGDGALIDGDINYTDCASLSEPPSDLTRSEGARQAAACAHPVPPRPRANRHQLVTITLSGTGMSHLAISELITQLGPTRQLVVQPTARSREATLLSLGETLAQYGAEGVGQAGALAAEHAQWGLAAHEAASMRGFLAALRTTTDYLSGVTRPQLLQRLDQVLATMHHHPAARREALRLMDDALTGCEDRIILGLDRIEVQQAVFRAHQSPDPDGALYQLGLGLLQLEVVDRHAAQTCARLGDDVDTVEVYLRYRTALRTRLNLPGAAVTMKYGSEVGDRELEAAAVAAAAALEDPAQKQAFFDAWDPWQAHLRAQQMAGCPYEMLPARNLQVTAAQHSGLRCPISLNTWADVQQPVFCAAGDGVEMYEFADLKEWWREHGTSPARGVPMLWAELFVVPQAP